MLTGSHENATRVRIVDELRRIADDGSVDDPAAISAYLKALEGG
ncbi:hypothetical protein QTI66_32840 [Variovorax sp. J22R133]|nr:hypothetical protein [Variovorax sp. J22R133]MDM0116916.1 hypothetical protein [Variovorax sp. J22R133]